jgi:hypothetical protein
VKFCRSKPIRKTKAVAAQSGKAQAAFQVAYFPPSSAPGTKDALAQGGTTQFTGAAATPAATNNPTAQASAGAGLGPTLASSQNSPLSAASQAKLQKLDQVPQQLGINPVLISLADRIALLPLENGPAAIRQYIQGLPTQTAVWNPATSQILAPSLAGQPGGSEVGGAGVADSASGSVASLAHAAEPTATGGTSPTNRSATTAFHPGAPSFHAAAAGVARTPDTTGQKVDISL